MRTISEAARRAIPGDTVTVHAGIYRERIDPPRGGGSNERRIVYRAAPGEKVSVRGSEVVNCWQPLPGGIWFVRLPDDFFGDGNPYAEALGGHWFIDKGRVHHPGVVYLDGHWLREAASMEELRADTGSDGAWFAEASGGWTTIRARFPGNADPNTGRVEINVRRAVFYPSRPGLEFITLQGFDLRHAATTWAPPTTEQIGLVGTNWGRGWNIEGNTIAYSACCGITLGKTHDPLDHELSAVEGTIGYDTYHGTLLRAEGLGWTMARVGGHLVRNNRISHCEQAGIAGSLGCVNSVIENNIIHDIHVRRQFAGWEQAGIKFHGAIDSTIRGNRIFRCNRGLWLDWMSQGTRVHGNLFFDNGPDHDLFVEVNHGPFIIDHNLLLSEKSLLNWSQGGAYVHNLFAGKIEVCQELKRHTPFHAPRSTVILGLRNIEAGDDRWVNNLFAGESGMPVYPEGAAAIMARGNHAIGNKSGGHVIQVHDEGARLTWCGPRGLPDDEPPCTGEELGRTRIGGLPFYDGSDEQVAFPVDCFGVAREFDAVLPGPFSRASFLSLSSPDGSGCVSESPVNCSGYDPVIIREGVRMDENGRVGG